MRLVLLMGWHDPIPGITWTSAVAVKSLGILDEMGLLLAANRTVIKVGLATMGVMKPAEEVVAPPTSIGNAPGTGSTVHW